MATSPQDSTLKAEPSAAPDPKAADRSKAFMGSGSGKASGSSKPRGRSMPRSPLAAIPLSTKLVASMLILLIVGTVGVSVAICQMADDYLMKRTDSQLIRQANLGIRNATLLRQEDLSKNGLGPTDYFLQIRDNDLHIISDDLNPMQVNGVISRPRLPADGGMGSIPMGQPTTVPAYVRVSQQASTDRDTMKRARAPWRVVAMQWKLHNELDDSEISGVLFIGLSMSDQDEAVHDLTAFCMIISVVVVLLGGVISVLLIQSTLVPLKRIEKTAAKIAAGDLSQRIPSFPENTEVGSLAASLNAMLTRIEHSFDEQRQTTEKMKQFVSDASHELRTPLAAIHGYAELYRMQRDCPGALERADKSIQHIEDSSTRMTVLVTDLLSLARLDEGRGIDPTLAVDLTGLVRDGVDDLHALDPGRQMATGKVCLHTEDQPAPQEVPVAASKGLPGLKGRSKEKITVGGHLGPSVSLDIQEGPLPPVQVTGDPSRLRQVITNIVGNIHRYTPSDSPVRVGLGLVKATIAPADLTRLEAAESSLGRLTEAIQVAENSHVGTDYAVIRVVDHGPGVPEESRSRLFERFYTADPSRAREKGGTGLGLAIVQSIVKAHQGFICASQTPGGGLTFTIVIPQGVRRDQGGVEDQANPAANRPVRL
ncbi:HAMP domain-containing sensor histidine kinase [uncultured Bifidobacterium sp.]|uniref:sensor histidine kinase n=1 Tax=uncultured Bifidobacterium sp. TaxID=165187 RepID=UPI0025E7F3DB|nr:HAMP domain-containing sensor histidine kinase [uncultured Bifidobacterium sp.]